MAKYCVKKGIQLIIVTILISFFSFAVIYAAPGDISGMYLNEQMSDEEKEAIRENLGLNKSMPEQYWGWAKEVLKGDFGISLANHTSVSEQILKRLPATLQLMGAALVLSVLLAIPLGLWSGISQKHMDRQHHQRTFLYRNVDPVLLARDGADHCICSEASYPSVIGDAFCGK